MCATTATTSTSNSNPSPPEGIIVPINNAQPLTFEMLPANDNSPLLSYALTNKQSSSTHLALIFINPLDKTFNFRVCQNYQGLGYGKTIYDNHLLILEKLGFKDSNDYKLRINNNPNHEFLIEMKIKGWIAKLKAIESLNDNTTSETDSVSESSQNSVATKNPMIKQILDEFKTFPHRIRFDEFNIIVEYLIKLGLPMESIADAINSNGINIHFRTSNKVPYFDDTELQKFLSFNIPGLKPTCMHKHFINGRNFAFMQLLGDVDSNDASLEFRKIWEIVKDEFARRKSSNFKYSSPFQHIILKWPYSGLLFKHANQDIKDILKRQAINMFDKLDSEHKYPWPGSLDPDSTTIFKVLMDAELMDADAYVQLYLASLNRNYNLQEFDSVISNYIDSEERKIARERIKPDICYPSPPGKWQKRETSNQLHRIPTVPVPPEMLGNRNISVLLKQILINEGIAATTPIQTNMKGRDKEGKIFVVKNLLDWLFGVRGTSGNLRVTKDGRLIAFPPQTPDFAIDLIQNALKELISPDLTV